MDPESCTTSATTYGVIKVCFPQLFSLQLILMTLSRRARRIFCGMVYLWNHLRTVCVCMGKRSHVSFALLLMTALQDLLMDWSLLRPHARYPFLRDELLYPDHVPVRYW